MTNFGLQREHSLTNMRPDYADINPRILSWKLTARDVVKTGPLVSSLPKWSIAGMSSENVNGVAS